MVNFRFFERTNDSLVELSEWKSSHNEDTANDWLSHMRDGNKIHFASVQRRFHDWKVKYNQDLDEYYSTDEGGICAYRRISCGEGTVVTYVCEESFDKTGDAEMDQWSPGAHPEETSVFEKTYFIRGVNFSKDGKDVYIILTDTKW